LKFPETANHFGSNAPLGQSFVNEIIGLPPVLLTIYWTSLEDALDEAQGVYSASLLLANKKKTQNGHMDKLMLQ